MPLVSHTLRLALLLLGLAALNLAAAPGAFAANEAALWAALKTPGHIAFMRHALAPGGGDPENFRVDDCSTQRNLSDAGRLQARRSGQAFRANKMASAVVFSSQWCRCNETAELLRLGAVTPLPALNSLYRRPQNEAPQMSALRGHIAALDLSKPTVMVTHQFTIRALVGTTTRSGEIVVVRREPDGSLLVRGKIAPTSTE